MSDRYDTTRRNIHWAVSGLKPRVAQRLLEEVAAEYEADAVIDEMEEETKRDLARGESPEVPHQSR